jgi:hypothetical protein
MVGVTGGMPPAILLQTASLILVMKWFVASSRPLSVEISFDFVAGSKWATLFPNGGFHDVAFGLTSLHDV